MDTNYFEKEYKDALERAKKTPLKTRTLSSEAKLAVRLALEYVFPALKESDDERIRTFLIDYFTSYKFGNVQTKLNGVKIDDIIAYLEKHKEQNPAEWSEEDEEMLNRIIDTYRRFPQLTTETFSRRQELGWLRLIKNRVVHPKAVPDFSEEDNNMLYDVIDSLIRYKSKVPSEKIDKQILWLKFLRPQPHWKPSEEQMEALERCADYLDESDNEDAAIINSIINDLKKLM